MDTLHIGPGKSSKLAKLWTEPFRCGTLEVRSVNGNRLRRRRVHYKRVKPWYTVHVPTSSTGRQPRQAGRRVSQTAHDVTCLPEQQQPVGLDSPSACSRILLV